jgi:primary-amine oxidase
MAPRFHPLQPLSVAETNAARQLVLDKYPGFIIQFREIFLYEPPKSQLEPFLDAEHAGAINESTKLPDRLANCFYDVVGSSKIPEYHEAVADLKAKKLISKEIISTESHASLTM